jgi:hypothetical protein
MLDAGYWILDAGCRMLDRKYYLLSLFFSDYGVK